MPARKLNLAELPALIGHEIGVSDWFTVSQALIDAFAAVTGDRQWIHVDPARAASESPFGTTIAHGFLTLALISELHREAIELTGCQRVLNYGLNRVRFPAPVLSGSRIRARSVLQAVENVTDAVQLTWNVTVEREGEQKPVLAAEWLVRVYAGERGQ